MGGRAGVRVMSGWVNECLQDRRQDEASAISGKRSDCLFGKRSFISVMAGLFFV